jgi:hypothetical protein
LKQYSKKRKINCAPQSRNMVEDLHKLSILSRIRLVQFMLYGISDSFFLYLTSESIKRASRREEEMLFCINLKRNKKKRQLHMKITLVNIQICLLKK